jgi:hypothetical protein
MHTSILLRSASLVGLGAPLCAQGAAFQTPGMPAYPPAPPPANAAQTGDMSQASRFTSAFNPAFSFVVDSLASYETVEGTDNDGSEIELRTLELGAQSWVDPNAWAYFLAASDGESLNVEEAAVHYTGLGGNSTIRAGRFFVDFGKQMQVHIHELRTIGRPLVLRAYLGEEVKGDGLQWDHWTPVGESSVVRWSLGGFTSLLPEEVEEVDPATSAVQSVEDRKDLGDFNFTARVTGFTDIGSNGILQLGASARFIPEYAFTFEPSGDVATGLENTVWGLDATYGWTDDTGLRKWTFGGEFLVDSGDNGATITDVGSDGDPTNDTVSVLDDTVNGWLAFVDHAWNPYDSAGLQYSAIELPDGAGSDLSESTAYFTHRFSEFHRLRFELSQLDTDTGEDSFRVGIQYTAFVGAHGHGVNW